MVYNYFILVCIDEIEKNATKSKFIAEHAVRIGLVLCATIYVLQSTTNFTDITSALASDLPLALRLLGN